MIFDDNSDNFCQIFIKPMLWMLIRMASPHKLPRCFIFFYLESTAEEIRCLLDDI